MYACFRVLLILRKHGSEESGIRVLGRWLIGSVVCRIWMAQVMVQCGSQWACQFWKRTLPMIPAVRSGIRRGKHSRRLVFSSASLLNLVKLFYSHLYTFIVASSQLVRLRANRISQARNHVDIAAPHRTEMHRNVQTFSIVFRSGSTVCIRFSGSRGLWLTLSSSKTICFLL